MIYLTADTHFGHARISELCGRPFSNVNEMNKTLIDNWNAVVGENDEVYHLGDFAMGQIKETLPLARELNGKKYLVPGNHCRIFPGNKHHERWAYEYQNVGFNILPLEWQLKTKFTTFKLCHFPYEGDSREGDRFKDYRPVDDGAWLLHGHVHNAWRINGKQINVGIDVWNYRPVSLGAIEYIVKLNGYDPYPKVWN